MKKKPNTKLAPQPNVHGFAPSGAIRATQVEGVRGRAPIPTTTNKQPVVKTKIQTSGHRGVQVGSDNDPNKWRCAICKRLNDNFEDTCKICKEPKKVFKPSPSKPVSNPKSYKSLPPKVSNRKPEIKEKQLKAQEEKKVMTMADLGPHPENLAKGKVRRKFAYSEEESLKVNNFERIETST